MNSIVGAYIAQIQCPAQSHVVYGSNRVTSVVLTKYKM